MNTDAEIEQAYADYRAGLFGPTERRLDQAISVAVAVRMRSGTVG